MFHEIEIWVRVDSDGNYVCCKNEGNLIDLWGEDEDISSTGLHARIMCIKLKVPEFQTTMLSATLPAVKTNEHIPLLIEQKE